MKKMIRIDEKYNELLYTVLLRIKRQLDMVYWNQNQKEMLSPFDNTGTEYQNDIFSVHAYNWSDEDDLTPNFEYHHEGVTIQIFWYKYAGRGMSAYANIPVGPEEIFQMHEACMATLRLE